MEDRLAGTQGCAFSSVHLYCTTITVSYHAVHSCHRDDLLCACFMSFLFHIHRWMAGWMVGWLVVCSDVNDLEEESLLQQYELVGECVAWHAILPPCHALHCPTL